MNESNAGKSVEDQTTSLTDDKIEEVQIAQK